VIIFATTTKQEIDTEAHNICWFFQQSINTTVCEKHSMYVL